MIFLVVSPENFYDQSRKFNSLYVDFDYEYTFYARKDCNFFIQSNFQYMFFYTFSYNIHEKNTISTKCVSELSWTEDICKIKKVMFQ